MNILQGKIVDINECGELFLIKVLLTPLQQDFENSLKDVFFKVVILDLKNLNLKIGSKVELFFKENDLILAQFKDKKALENLNFSLFNELDLQISKAKKGVIFTQIFFKDTAFTKDLSALILSGEAENFNINTQAKIKAYINSNDIVIKVL